MEIAMKKQALQQSDSTNEFQIGSSTLLIIFVTLMMISNAVFAVDLLAGTDADIKDTMTGTGKHWLLWIDGGISLAAFAYSKKPMVFFSVLGISLFITALVKMASGA